MATTEYTATTTRTQRGIKLYRERRGEITFAGDVYRVPGSNGESYAVKLEGGGYCSCPDHAKRGRACKHIYCCELLSALEACRRRKPRKTDRSHRAESLRGIVVNVDALDALAERMGV